MAKSDKLLADLMLLHPKLIDLSLGRVKKLLSKLGQPHERLPAVVHIAGTNGKGSTIAFLKSMLLEAGYRVHVYTSPHLVSFHERIVLANNVGKSCPIEEEYLIDILTRTQAVNDGDNITQFEITTAAAFLAFSEVPADFLLLEVGLGGRLDATNVVEKPSLSIITPISFDHIEKLGSTLAQIAQEKAGILKSGVKAIISRQEESALSVISEKARSLETPLLVWGKNLDAYEENGRMVVEVESQVLDLPLPALVGRHQIVNAGTAVAAALHLGRISLSEHAIERGLANTRWPARMQRLLTGPLTGLLNRDSELWLDGGHNPGAGVVLAQTLADLEEKSSKPAYLVVGMMGLKDALGFLSPFRGLVHHIYTVPVPGHHEIPSFSPEELKNIAIKCKISSEAARCVEDALKLIEMRHGTTAKRVLICGSLYLAGQVLAHQDR
ncbi:MAG: bifunctional folylpolyglutamate synthase/dihydrofolate synthase [Hyphomicrobium sp.]